MAVKKANRATISNIAHHEAGHVVAHWVLGLANDKATIRRNADALGRVKSPSVMGYEGCATAASYRQIARACIISCYAGTEAELLFDPAADRSGGSGDNQNAYTLMHTFNVVPRSCSIVGDDACHAYLERLRTNARRLVKRHWRIVQAVAAELLKRKTLDGAALEKLKDRLQVNP